MTIYTATINCADGEVRSVAIYYDDEFADDIYRPIRLTELSFGHSFKPFETIVPQTGIVGIYFDPKETESREDERIYYIAPTTGISHRIVVKRGDVVEFDGFLVPNSASMPLLEYGASISFNIISRLGVLDSVSAAFAVNVNETFKTYSLYQIACKALTDSKLYTENDKIYVPLKKYTVGGDEKYSILDRLIIGAGAFHKFYDEKIYQLHEAVDANNGFQANSVKEVLEKIAQQTFTTFVDRGDSIYVLTSRTVAAFSVRPIKSSGWGNPLNDHVEINKEVNITSNIMADSSWSIMTPSSVISFNGQPDLGGIDISKDDFAPEKAGGGAAQYGDRINEKHLTLHTNYTNSTSYKTYEGYIRTLYVDSNRYSKTRLIMPAASVETMQIETDWLSGLALYFTRINGHFTDYQNIFQITPQWLLSANAGYVVLSFDYKLVGRINPNNYEMTVLDNGEKIEDDQKKLSYQFQFYIKDENGNKIAGKEVVSKELSLANYNPERIQLKIPINEMSAVKRSFWLGYRFADDSTVRQFSLYPFIQNISLHYQRTENYIDDDIPSKIIYDFDNHLGPETSFSIPFMEFFPIYNNFAKNSLIELPNSGEEDVMKNEMISVSLFHGSAKNQYKLKLRLRNLGDSFAFRYGEENVYGYGGEQHDLLAGTTEYTLNQTNN